MAFKVSAAASGNFLRITVSDGTVFHSIGRCYKLEDTNMSDIDIQNMINYSVAKGYAIINKTDEAEFNGHYVNIEVLTSYARDYRSFSIMNDIAYINRALTELYFNCYRYHKTKCDELTQENNALQNKLSDLKSAISDIASGI